MLSFYLAARVSRADEIRDYAEQLVLQGHPVHARWLEAVRTGVHANRDAMTVQDRAYWAERDLHDIRVADAFILFTEHRLHPAWKPSSGDGRLVEFGYALGRHKQVFVVGPRENLFVCLPKVRHAETWEAFIASLPILTARG